MEELSTKLDFRMDRDSIRIGDAEENGSKKLNISFGSDLIGLKLVDGSICTVFGRIHKSNGKIFTFHLRAKVQKISFKLLAAFHSWLDSNIHFKTALADAEKIVVEDGEAIEIETAHSPIPIKVSRSVRIIGTKFSRNSPVETIVLNILTGELGEHGVAEANISLMNASISFKSSQEMRFTGNSQILMDKIVLFNGDIALPTLAENSSDRVGSHRLIHFFSQTVEWNIYLSSVVALTITWVLAASTAWLAVILGPLTYLAFSRRGRLSNYIRYLLPTNKPLNISFFLNGWQAWSFCGAVLHGSQPPIYSMPNMFAKGFHDGGEGTSLPFNLGEENGNAQNSAALRYGWRGVAVEKDFFLASDMFTAVTDLSHKCGLMLGFLTQKLQFGCIAINRSFSRLTVHISGDGVHIVPASTISTDWLALYGFNSLVEPFLPYMVLSRDANNAKVVSRKTGTLLNEATVPVGWCSWYHFFQNISEKDLLNNLECMKRMKEKNNLFSSRLGFNLFQIDDGYQNAWGDWAEVNKLTFPSQSLYNIVRKVKEENMVGGVWMAPFACDKHSVVAKKHPEWILRGKGQSSPGNTGNCGYVSSITKK